MFTGDVEVPANPHELITEDVNYHLEKRPSRTKGLNFGIVRKICQCSFFPEVKILSIPKIAISNEDDSSLRILENHLKSDTNSHPSSPHKSIIKTRSSQPQSPSSSSTSQSFHTCLGSIPKDSLNVSNPLKRSLTMSVMKPHGQQKAIRRINSYQSSSRRRPIINPERKVQLTVDDASTEIDRFSVYETPKHDETSIRLIMESDPSYSTVMNNQSDMQIHREDQIQSGVSVRERERFDGISFVDSSNVFCEIMRRTIIELCGKTRGLCFVYIPTE